MGIAEDKGADSSVVRFARVIDSTTTISGGPSRAPVRRSLRSPYQDDDHEGHGLVLAILLCMTCWGALGFFLLK